MLALKVFKECYDSIFIDFDRTHRYIILKTQRDNTRTGKNLLLMKARPLDMYVS